MSPHSVSRPPAALRYDWSAASDLGRRRTNNEDSWGAWALGDGARPLAAGAGILPDAGLLLAVSDGMGGAEGGEVASRMCIEQLGQRLSGAGPDARPEDLLPPVFDQIHAALMAHAGENPGLRGMGATLTAAWLQRDGRVTLCHIGDSRLYHGLAGAWRQVSEDQSVGAGLVRRGEMSEEAVSRLRYRSMLEQVMGGDGAPLRPQVTQFACPAGSSLLLCSDGLHGPLGTELTARTDAALRERDLAAGAARLVAAANEAGGPDNITVILARLLPGSEP